MAKPNTKPLKHFPVGWTDTGERKQSSLCFHTQTTGYRDSSQVLPLTDREHTVHAEYLNLQYFTNDNTDRPDSGYLAPTHVKHSISTCQTNPKYGDVNQK